MNSGTLTLIRHGQSIANAAGQFTGILDVPLTERGRTEAVTAAVRLTDAGPVPAHVFTSELRRAIDTARLVAGSRRAVRDWRLNERNYGALTGRSKSDVIHEFGPEQFLAWRRSVDQAPPPMSDVLYDQLAHTALFERLPAAALVRTEALRAVIVRVGEFYRHLVVPLLTDGNDVLVVAHGNSLRALCAILDDLDDDALERLNIPTGQPLIYHFDSTLRPTIPGGRYLDETSAIAAANVLAHEGGT